jgi:hypothetical protein
MAESRDYPRRAFMGFARPERKSDDLNGESVTTRTALRMFPKQACDTSRNLSCKNYHVLTRDESSNL